MIYRIFNYWTIPWGLFTLFIILIVIMSKKMEKLSGINPESKKRMSKVSRVIAKVTYFLVAFGILLFKYEELLIFKTPQEILNYHYPFNKVVKIYDYKDYVYLLFHNIYDDSYSMEHYEKQNKKWISTDSNEDTILFNNYCHANISQIKDKNVIGIEISCFGKKDNPLLIEDSLLSTFESYGIRDDEDENEFYYIYFTTVKGKLDKDYTITINGKEYKVSKCMKKNKYLPFFK